MTGAKIGARGEKKSSAPDAPAVAAAAAARSATSAESPRLPAASAIEAGLFGRALRSPPPRTRGEAAVALVVVVTFP